jgi:uncharacterized cupredoxin-like copper-binding protein
MARRLTLLLSIVAPVALLASACSSDDGGVGVTLADFTVTPDPTSASAGEVTFDVTNDADQIHEFVVVQTDLAPDALPTNEDGDVDEEGEGITPVDEIEDIAGGTEQSLTVDLDAGSYVLLCNLPTHYSEGMYSAFTVS